MEPIRHGFLYFASPPDKDLEWSDQGVEGAHRFLSRLWRYMEENIESLNNADPTPITMDSLVEPDKRNLKRRIHKTIELVTRDIEVERQFNTAVARFMELFNEMNSYEPKDKTDWSLLREGCGNSGGMSFSLRTYICEELWDMLGHKEYSRKAVMARLIRKHKGRRITIVVQINGKGSRKLVLPAGLSEDEMVRRYLRIRRFKGG